MKKWWMCWKDEEDGHCKILFKFGSIPVRREKTIELSPRPWVGWERYYRAELDGSIITIPAGIKIAGNKYYIDNPDYLEISNHIQKRR